MKKDNSGITSSQQTASTTVASGKFADKNYFSAKSKDKPMLLVDIFTRPVYDDIQLWKILYEKPKDIDFKLPRTFAGIAKGTIMKYVAVKDPANAEGKSTLSDGSNNNRDNLRYVEIQGSSPTDKPSLELKDDKRTKLKSVKPVEQDVDILTVEGPDIDIPKPNLYGYSIKDSTKPIDYEIDMKQLNLLIDNPDLLKRYYSALYYKHPELNIGAPNLDIVKPNVKGTSIQDTLLLKPCKSIGFDNLSPLVGIVTG